MTKNITYQRVARRYTVTFNTVYTCQRQLTFVIYYNVICIIVVIIKGSVSRYT